MNRRDIIRLGTSFLGTSTFCHQMSNAKAASKKKNIQLYNWSYGMPPIFCTAYIDPGIRSQRGQEQTVSRYPLALIPQDSRAHFKIWRNKVHRYNPKIKLLAYQMVIEETTVPGPGHDIMRGLDGPWLKKSNNDYYTVDYKTNKGNRKRVYDPTSDEWKNALLTACEKVLDSWAFDGLLLDQCTVYKNIVTEKESYEKMMRDLRSTILALRSKFKDKIIIANSRHQFSGLNGELNENRPRDLYKESRNYEGHSDPRIELFQYYMKNNDEDILPMLKIAMKNKVFFSACVNAQHVKWFKFFENIKDHIA